LYAGFIPHQTSHIAYLITMQKIYVAEDNQTETMLFRLAFQNIAHFQMSYFASGQQLWEQIEKEAPAVVVLDFMLPDTEGFDLVSKIKTFAPATRIVVVSAQENMQVIEKLQAAGIHQYVIKSASCLRYLRQAAEEQAWLYNRQKI
jgi:CheY-like chemotaxis protein